MPPFSLLGHPSAHVILGLSGKMPPLKHLRFGVLANRIGIRFQVFGHGKAVIVKKRSIHPWLGQPLHYDCPPVHFFPDPNDAKGNRFSTRLLLSVPLESSVTKTSNSSSMVCLLGFRSANIFPDHPVFRRLESLRLVLSCLLDLGQKIVKKRRISELNRFSENCISATCLPLFPNSLAILELSDSNLIFSAHSWGDF